jgi:hypothetical protein
MQLTGEAREAMSEHVVIHVAALVALAAIVAVAVIVAPERVSDRLPAGK